MTNVFMENFKERLTHAMTISAVIVLGILTIPSLFGIKTISALPSHMIPAVLAGLYVYGAGWYFSAPILKKIWSKILNAGYSVSFKETVQDFGLTATIVCSVVCFMAGCILAGTVGVYMMVSDFILAKQGKPLASMKQSLASNAEYIIWERNAEEKLNKQSSDNIGAVYTNEVISVNEGLAA